MDDKARIFVQWKGTDVCLDLHCVCGYDGHCHGMFAYSVQCGGCERVYQMPYEFFIEPGDDDDPHLIAFGGERNMHVPTGEGVPDVAVVIPTVFEMQEQRDEYRRQLDGQRARIAELERQRAEVLALCELPDIRLNDTVGAYAIDLAQEICKIYGGGE